MPWPLSINHRKGVDGMDELQQILALLEAKKDWTLAELNEVKTAIEKRMNKGVPAR